MPDRRVRDSRLIDALEAAEAEPFEGRVWRVVRSGKDPLQCGSAGGRWDDRTFDVLYTATVRDGAVAEMHFHLSRGLPVLPSRVRYRLYELSVTLQKLVRLPTLTDLAKLGLNTDTFGQLSYDDRTREYPRTQDIAEAAHFLEYDGILVPNARWNCTNVIIFCDRVTPSAIEFRADHGEVDWATWRRANVRSP